jgi:G:T/U-mismatch repair DNA glycosylase
MIDEMSNIMFNWVKFTTGVTAIILPVIWGALDAQARNREIQEKIQNEKAIEKSRQEAITASTEAEKQIADSRAKLMEKQQEIYRLKALLIAKTENVNALDEACKAADALKGGEIDLL